MLSGIDLATSCIMSGEGVRMDVASKIRVLKTVYATSFAATRVARKMWQRSVAIKRNSSYNLPKFKALVVTRLASEPR